MQGTMTFGEQNDREGSFAQLDKATKELGINFIVRCTPSRRLFANLKSQDTAESYPVPSDPATTGTSETIIGEWLKKKGSLTIYVYFSSS